jgi:hypothetical protein
MDFAVTCSNGNRVVPLIMYIKMGIATNNEEDI